MDEQKEKESETQLGYLVMKLKSGQGIIINGDIEVRLCAVNRDFSEAQIAIRAPKDKKIRRV